MKGVGRKRKRQDKIKERENEECVFAFCQFGDRALNIMHSVVGARFEFQPCQPGDVEVFGPPR